jgi:hypothetical protein
VALYLPSHLSFLPSLLHCARIPFALPPPCCSSASATDTRLVKGPDGRMRLDFGRRPLIAGGRRDVLGLTMPAHLPDAYDRRRAMEKADADSQRAKRGARPAFSPVGPRLAFELPAAGDAPSLALGTARSGAASPSKAGGSAPASPRAGAASPSQPYNPYSSTARGLGAPWKDYPAYKPSPYVVFPDGGMGLLRSGSAGGGGGSRGGSPARSGTARTDPGAGAGAGGGARASSPAGSESGRGGWRPSNGQGASHFRPVKSVVTHPANMRQLSKAGGAATVYPGLGTGGPPGSPVSPVRLSAYIGSNVASMLPLGAEGRKPKGGWSITTATGPAAFSASLGRLVEPSSGAASPERRPKGGGWGAADFRMRLPPMGVLLGGNPTPNTGPAGGGGLPSVIGSSSGFFLTS